jgi:hypothetical protein
MEFVDPCGLCVRSQLALPITIQSPTFWRRAGRAALPGGASRGHCGLGRHCALCTGPVAAAAFRYRNSNVSTLLTPFLPLIIMYEQRACSGTRIQLWRVPKCEPRTHMPMISDSGHTSLDRGGPAQAPAVVWRSARYGHMCKQPGPVLASSSDLLHDKLRLVAWGKEGGLSLCTLGLH